MSKTYGEQFAEALACKDVAEAMHGSNRKWRSTRRTSVSSQKRHPHHQSKYRLHGGL